MIDPEELKLRIIKSEQINSEIKTNLQAKSGKLGPHQINTGIKNQGIDNIAQKNLKNF